MFAASWLGIRPRRERAAAAAATYVSLVRQAREPAFFAEFGVPDTLDGRFEMVALHAYLVLSRLKADHGVAAAFAQALFDTLFADMDQSLREMGVSDLGVGRRVKAMAQALYGRIRAYEEGLAAGEAALADALRRNLYGTLAAPPAKAVPAMIGYLRCQRAALTAQPIAMLMAGKVEFLPVTVFIAGEIQL